MNIDTKSSHIKSTTVIVKEVVSRINKNLTDKSSTHLNPHVEQKDNLVKRAIDDCTQRFHIFEYECVFVVKINHATHGNINFCTLTIEFKNQYEEVEEANELSLQIDEFEKRKSGYTFDNIKKSTVTMLRYHDLRASSY